VPRLNRGGGDIHQVSTLELFQRILDDSKHLPRTSAYRDLGRFIDFVIKRLFKASRENPLIFLEVRFMDW
jgi:replication fork protection complex subunit Tof1/Swi1